MAVTSPENILQMDYLSWVESILSDTSQRVNNSSLAIFNCQLCDILPLKRNTSQSNE